MIIKLWNSDKLIYVCSLFMKRVYVHHSMNILTHCTIFNAFSMLRKLRRTRLRFHICDDPKNCLNSLWQVLQVCIGERDRYDNLLTHAWIKIWKSCQKCSSSSSCHVIWCFADVERWRLLLLSISRLCVCIYKDKNYVVHVWN